MKFLLKTHFLTIVAMLACLCAFTNATAAVMYGWVYRGDEIERQKNFLLTLGTAKGQFEIIKNEDGTITKRELPTLSDKYEIFNERQGSGEAWYNLVSGYPYCYGIFLMQKANGKYLVLDNKAKAEEFEQDMGLNYNGSLPTIPPTFYAVKNYDLNNRLTQRVVAVAYKEKDANGAETIKLHYLKNEWNLDPDNYKCPWRE